MAPCVARAMASAFAQSQGGLPRCSQTCASLGAVWSALALRPPEYHAASSSPMAANALCCISSSDDGRAGWGAHDDDDACDAAGGVCCGTGGVGVAALVDLN